MSSFTGERNSDTPETTYTYVYNVSKQNILLAALKLTTSKTKETAWKQMFWLRSQEENIKIQSNL